MAGAAFRLLLSFAFLGWCAAQLAGTTKKEQPPPVVVGHCTKAGGCSMEQMSVTMDANWRWVHGVACSGDGPEAQCSSSGNCYTDGSWDAAICKDPTTCAAKCALEGITAEDYEGTYGVSAIPGGVQLNFVSMGAGGMNVGSRLYLLDTAHSYKQFKLLNREFTFDVDVSELPCGLNGAVYFSEMPKDGGHEKGNKAGAKFGTGYCDAQCPHDVKFMKGYANVLGWNSTDSTGKWGQCCVEVDIWEANRDATAFTMHPCSIEGAYVCKGKECGDNKKNERYMGVCDKDGCDFNSYRMGDHSFFGKGSEFAVDTSKPVTVVTQFLTDDGTDDGDLAEVRRLYVQGGKVIQNSKASILGSKDAGDSLTDELCAVQKKKFGDPDDFAKKGGMKATGEALRRGMTLVLSLWDDFQSEMLWLDSIMGKGGRSRPGTLRGPCGTDTGVPADVRAKYPDAKVTYTNIMYGEIGTTYKTSTKPDSVEADGVASDEPAGTSSGGSSASGSSSSASSSPSSGGAVAAYQQCGGTGWSGPTQCQEGCRCAAVGGPSYSQCVPPSGQNLCGGGGDGGVGGMVNEVMKKNELSLRGEAGASPRGQEQSASAAVEEEAAAAARPGQFPAPSGGALALSKLLSVAVIPIAAAALLLGVAAALAPRLRPRARRPPNGGAYREDSEGLMSLQ